MGQEYSSECHQWRLSVCRWLTVPCRLRHSVCSRNSSPQRLRRPAQRPCRMCEYARHVPPQAISRLLTKQHQQGHFAAGPATLFSLLNCIQIALFGAHDPEFTVRPKCVTFSTTGPFPNIAMPAYIALLFILHLLRSCALETAVPPSSPPIQPLGSTPLGYMANMS